MQRELDRLWTGAKGAGRYVAAITTGDLASEQASAERLSHCRGCEAITLERGLLTGRVAAFCGPSLVERDGPDVPQGERTCGCLIGVVPRWQLLGTAAPEAAVRRVALELLEPAGKARVASESCPRGKWGPVDRASCGVGGCGCQAAAGAAQGDETGPERGRIAGAANAP